MKTIRLHIFFKFAIMKAFVMVRGENIPYITVLSGVWVPIYLYPSPGPH